jgi:hypothetical protein
MLASHEVAEQKICATRKFLKLKQIVCITADIAFPPCSVVDQAVILCNGTSSSEPCRAGVGVPVAGRHPHPAAPVTSPRPPCPAPRPPHLQWLRPRRHPGRSPGCPCRRPARPPCLPCLPWRGRRRAARRHYTVGHRLLNHRQLVADAGQEPEPGPCLVAGAGAVPVGPPGRLPRVPAHPVLVGGRDNGQQHQGQP